MGKLSMTVVIPAHNKAAFGKTEGMDKMLDELFCDYNK